MSATPAPVVTANVVANPEDEWPIESVNFRLQVAGVEARMSFSGFGSEAPEPTEWLALLGSAPAEVALCESNGEVKLASNGTDITFHTSRYGGGGDGDIQVQLPVAICREAIEKVAAEIARANTSSALIQAAREQ